MESENLSLTIIDKSIDVFRGGSELLRNHEDISKKAMAVADKQLIEWQEADNITDPEKQAEKYANLDARSEKLLVNCRTRKVELMESRKAITSLMDTIKGLYTTQENSLEVKTSVKLISIQQRRNVYATWRRNEDARKEREAQQKENKAKEAAEIRSKYNSYISEWTLTFLNEKKISVNNSFNGITLENFADKEARLPLMKTEFPKDKLVFTMPGIIAVYHTATELDAISQEVRDGYDYESFYTKYQADIETMKRDLIDKLPSKLKELNEAEAQRVRAIEEEKERQEKILKEKDLAKKKQLEIEAENQRVAAENEKKRLENQTRIREEEEKIKIQKQADEDKRLAQEKIDLKKQEDELSAMFTKTQETMSDNAAPSSKAVMEITVNNPLGWGLMFQFWFEREGKTLSLEELEKKTFKQVKTFVEKEAMKDKPEMIESKTLTYKEVTKAINKKPKTEKVNNE